MSARPGWRQGSRSQTSGDSSHAQAFPSHSTGPSHSAGSSWASLHELIFSRSLILICFLVLCHRRWTTSFICSWWFSSFFSFCFSFFTSLLFNLSLKFCRFLKPHRTFWFINEARYHCRHEITITCHAGLYHQTHAFMFAHIYPLTYS